MANSYPQDLRPPKHQHIMFVCRRALPFIGDSRKIVQLDVVGGHLSWERRALHEAFVVLRHLAE